MSVRRLSVPKTVHLIYNREYGEDKEFVDHLPDIRVPLQQLGYQVKEYFVSPDTVKPLTRDIPPNDPSHIIFLHVDMPHKVPLGTRIETVRYLESKFKYITGHRADICENCVWKSVMNACFDKGQVCRVPSIRVESVDFLVSDQLRSGLIKNPAMRMPLFIKVDDGFNSLGLSNASVINTIDDLVREGSQMLSLYGPILIQPYLSGREFTVAVSTKQAYHPIERVFEPGQLVSQPGGTKAERLLDDSEIEIIKTIQSEAFAAFRAVKGTAYGRVDLREDPLTGLIYVLEVNNTCSLAPNSYFQLSVEYCGSSIKKILRSLLTFAVATK